MGKGLYLVADVQLPCSPHFYNLELLVAFLGCVKFVQWPGLMILNVGEPLQNCFRGSNQNNSGHGD